ncbi:hypothetical protein M501DRAFT_989683 [Patellaria atrata CBS 101060]|uniref:Acyl-coenzyme A diphosphatase SCS3 n=1 Tax=Patellaria atrata CBS 101060 TaxID=1346257 RepID=A0A9P4SE70_9PEZI|nr:hypothetical protein M501DRAFT_989683 [Patellaria atrata CBS 101060]
MADEPPQPRSDRKGSSRSGRSRNGPLPREVMVSKKLSWLLRHGAEKEGLKLGVGGYVNLADVLNNQSIRSMKVTFAEIRGIVNTNDKQRFSLIPVPGPSSTTQAPPTGASTSDPSSSQDVQNTIVPPTDDAATSAATSLSPESENPSEYLIRANQGHSIAVATQGLLEPITEENLPDICVHGTTYSAWPLIVESGGLKRMTRNHVHFAAGLPKGIIVTASGGSKKENQVGEGEEDKVEPSKDNAPAAVISGMRTTSSILIFVDIRKAMESGLKFWKSENKVILCEGDDNGLIRLEFFERVVERDGTELVKDGVVVGEIKASDRSKLASKHNLAKYRSIYYPLRKESIQCLLVSLPFFYNYRTMSSRRKPPPTSSSASNGIPVTIKSTTTTFPIPPSKPQMMPTMSPLVPTTLESLLLAIYPTTLMIGSLFSTLSPLTRYAPYNPVTQSHPPEFAPSYFATKKNVFNIWFVKKGWFWLTVAFWGFVWTHRNFKRKRGDERDGPFTRKRVQATARYLVGTIFWLFVTQWFFGAPIIDRGFTFTGGQCEILEDPAQKAQISEPRKVVTAAACKLAGGQWRGGHDISGHVFLLVLASAMLWFEVLPVVLHAAGLRESRSIDIGAGIIRNAAAEAESDANQEETGFGTKLALGIAAFMWWMLLMTAAFFHTWFEKLTGLVVAFTAIWVIYFLPRKSTGVRSVLGMPGV